MLSLLLQVTKNADTVKVMRVVITIAYDYYNNTITKLTYNKSLNIINLKYNVKGHQNYKKYGSVIMANHYNITDVLVLNSIFDDAYTICRDDLFKEFIANKTITDNGKERYRIRR